MEMQRMFVSETELEEKRKKRQEEWTKVRTSDQPEENLVRGIDDDESDFLGTVDEMKEKIIREKELEEQRELKEFHISFSRYHTLAIIECAERKCRRRGKLIEEEDATRANGVATVAKPTVAPKKSQQHQLILKGVKRKAAPEAPEEEVDNRSLYDRLQEQKIRKQEEFDEARKLKERPDEVTKPCRMVLPGMDCYEASSSDDSDSERDDSLDEEYCGHPKTNYFVSPFPEMKKKTSISCAAKDSIILRHAQSDVMDEHYDDDGFSEETMISSKEGVPDKSQSPPLNGIEDDEDSSASNDYSDIRTVNDIISKVYFPKYLKWRGKCLCRTSLLDQRKSKQKQCEAWDDVSCVTLRCTSMSTIVNARSSRTHAVKALCKNHFARLKAHECCPFCDSFCTQGTFLVCSEVREEFHFFHAICALKFYHGNRSSVVCPHCDHQPNLGFHEWTKRLILDSLSDYPKNHRIHVRLPKEDEKVIQPRGTRARKRPGKSFKELLNSWDEEKMDRVMKKISSERFRPSFNLYEACLFGDIKSLVWLLNNGAIANEVYPDRKNRRPAHAAAFGDQLAVLVILHNANADLNAQDEESMTPMMCAARKNLYNVVEFLLRKNVSPYTKDELGKTALHIAAESNSFEVVKTLVEFSPKPKRLIDMTDNGSFTALNYAVDSSLVQIVEYLLANGADPNIPDEEGNRLIHWCAFYGSVEMLESALETRCDINVQNKKGDTPLHLAARCMHYECVDLLISRGANLDLRNCKGSTPRETVGNDRMCSLSGLLGLTEVLSSDAVDLRKDEDVGNALVSADHPVPSVSCNAVQMFSLEDISCGRERVRIPWINEEDDEEFPSQSFTYICLCEDVCSEKCPCVVKVFEDSTEKKVVGMHTLDADGRCSEDVVLDRDGAYLVECRPSCNCDPILCNNKLVHTELRNKVQIFKTKFKDWGLRAGEDIRSRTFVCPYAGECVMKEDALKRCDLTYTLQFANEKFLWIDAKEFGNVARFINHSCEPNLMVIPVLRGSGMVKFVAGLFALRDIRAGEELTMDYGSHVLEQRDFECQCGSRSCVSLRELLPDANSS
ncbi:unnamed protein product [Notodromas monacha]|uniref:SET domain-containing protein n=1 Tax=Notodromas monacha TaxID=399045 RepID=A0A7R9BFB6_9CRUS|nr:unnamed protein product [Notodromas monacha]CAG0913146.1 unnamed protein product [Notodromas monacha]